MNARRMVVLGTVWGCLVLGGPIVRAETTSALVGKLTSADESVRLQAIDQLGARGEKAAEAVAPLTELLKDSSVEVRAHAARSLGEIVVPAKPAVAALAQLVKDPDETVRRQAVRAVMAIRPGPQITVPLAVDLLEDSDPGVRIRILHAVADAGPKAVPALIVALKNEKAAYWACLVLREIGPAAKDAVPALVEKLQDPRPEIPPGSDPHAGRHGPCGDERRGTDCRGSERRTRPGGGDLCLGPHWLHPPGCRSNDARECQE